jgi:catechol 2,3-dioxygenase-like lactoylglutathione lyase family enzyme
MRYPHIAITVDDFEKTKEFYSKIGFTISGEKYTEKKNRYFCLLTGYNFHIEVFHFDTQDKDQRYDNDIEKVQVQHIAFPVDDLEERRDEVLERNINLKKDISLSSSGIKYINIIDPNGFILEFFENER